MRQKKDQSREIYKERKWDPPKKVLNIFSEGLNETEKNHSKSKEEKKEPFSLKNQSV